VGGQLNDRLYGGGGLDQINAGSGNDYVEGGAEFDSLYGEQGNDTLVGGEGGDWLEGGAGKDLLLGGTGIDTYNFTAGWGADTIEDSGGQGTIQIEGIGTLNGLNATKVAGNVWQTADKLVNYTLVSQSLTRSDLYISFSDRTDVIVVRNWSAGQSLGITLAGALVDPVLGSILSGDFTKTTKPDDPTKYVIGSDGNYVAAGPRPGEADLITGTAGADLIQGLLGDDALLGRGGDDLLDGGEGNDILMGGMGSDTLRGGAGIDVIYGSSNGVLIYPTDTNYTRPTPLYPALLGQGFTWTHSSPGLDPDGLAIGWIESTVGRETPTSDNGNVIDGGAGQDYIYAGTGADVVHGGEDADAIVGMGGNDMLFGDEGGDRIYGDGANDTTLVTHTPAELHGMDVIDGGAGNDTLLGQGNDDVIYGGEGNDKVYGDDRSKTDTPAEAHGKDYLDGGNGSDTLIGGGRDDDLFGGAGDDILWGDAGPADPASSIAAWYHGDDYLDGGVGNDYVKGEGGFDTLIGGAGNDTLYGDEDVSNLATWAHGDDYLVGGDGDDYLDGQGGGDYLAGGVGADTLLGGVGNDTLDGGDGLNYVDGGKGDDVLMVSMGDHVIGGSGNDTFVLRGVPNQSSLDFAAGWNGAGQDRIVLDSGVEISSLRRQSQDLIMDFAGGGSTVVSNYFGVYAVDPQGDAAGLSVELADGTVWGEAAISNQVVESSVSLQGAGDDDELVGSKYGDTVAGAAGQDRINGRDGDDDLSGGDGNDLLLGGAGNDMLSGGAGEDVLDGGTGNDLLVGGAGADIYRFDKGAGQDTIGGASALDAPFDIVQLGKGISTKDVSVLVRTDGLVLSIAGAADQLLIKNNLPDGSGRTTYAAGQIRFDNGTSWDLAEYASSDLNDSLVGNAGNNVIAGNDGRDTLSGLGGADTLSGGNGNDQLDGGIDNDDILGGAGADTLLGGDGNDRLGGEDQFDSTSASLLSGDDLINGGAGDDSLYGGNGVDTLEGGAGADLLYGGSGDDLLRGGSGADRLNGGAGNDAYEVSLEDMLLGPNGEIETIDDSEGVNALTLGASIGSVSVTGVAGSSDVVLSVDGQHGVRVVAATTGAIASVQFVGTATPFAMDRLIGERLQQQVSQTVSTARASLFGGALNDVLSASETAADATISGGRGNDLITLGSLSGGTVLFSIGDGSDTLRTNFELGSTRTADNVLKLGAGIALTDLRLLNLGAGQFTLQVGNSAVDGITFAMDSLQMKGGSRPFDRVVFADGSTATWTQVVDLGVLSGAAGVTLNGTAADETITGGAGVDALNGGAGNDELHGGDSRDDLNGGDGRDTLYGDGGNDSLVGGGGGDYLYGGDGNDRLVGDDIANAVVDIDPNGGNSEDRLYGGAGNDTLYGGNGYDQLDGGAGNDSLLGGAGDDSLIGGDDGTDTMHGGLGNDTITFGSRASGGVADGEAGNDLIYAFGENKTVRFGRGSGQDQISGSVANGVGGTLLFSGGISVADLSFSHPADEPFSSVGERLDIRIGGSNDMVSVTRFLAVGGLNDNANSLQKIQFSDGTILTEDDILRRLFGTTDGSFNGGAGKDVRVGGRANDTLFGNAGDDLLWGAEGDDQIRGGDGSDDLRGGAGSDVLDGGEGSDSLMGGDGNDLLIGGGGYDVLRGGRGHDTLDGGAGIGDQLYGDEGNDTYRWGRGYGAVYLSNQDSSVGKTDTVEILSGVLSSEVLVRRPEGSDDLVLQLTGTSDSLTIHNYFYLGGRSEYSVEVIRFPNGTAWRYADVNPVQPVGTPGNDRLWGYGGNDTISGGAGNDTISGGGGNDLLSGDEGDDQLTGGTGASLLLGGAGQDWLVGGPSDTLSGGAGDDSYGATWDPTGATIQFARGDGRDRVYGAANATLRLAAGIAPSDIVLTTYENGAQYNEYRALRIAVAGTTDSIDIQDFFTSALRNPSGNVLRVVFADGTEWNQAFLLAKAYSGTAGNDYIVGTFYGESISGAAGDDALFGGDGADQIFGGDGSDYLQGGYGNDTLDGGAGNDDLVGDWGDDSFFWGRGSGQDRIIGQGSTYGYDQLFVSALSSDVWVTEWNNTITIGIDGTQDRIVLEDELFPAGPGRFGPTVEIVQFADGVRWDVDALLRQTRLGSPNDDWLNGSNADEYLDGQAGNDYLFGVAGADTLRGGPGDDRMFGGAGDDTYILGRGDGFDIISAAAGEGMDTLRFESGIARADVSVVRLDDRAFLTFAGGNNAIVCLESYYSMSASPNPTTYRWQFADGTTVDAATVQQLLASARIDAAPVLAAALPTLQAKQGSAFQYVVAAGTFTDSDAGDTIGYSVWGLPAWLSFDAATRTLSGTPAAANRGTAVVTVAGSDQYGAGAQTSLTINVGSTNRSPIVANAIADKTAAIGGVFSYTVPANAFSDPDTVDTLALSASLSDGSALPSWLSFNPATRTFSGTPSAPGTATIRVTARDGWGGSVFDEFVVTSSLQNLSVTGTANADTLNGGAGNDSLSGLAGNDNLVGMAGNDSLNGGTGNDTMLGGAGNDTYVVDAVGDVVTELTNEGTDTVQSSATLTLGSNVENLTLTGTSTINGTGNTLDNVLTGNSANNTLTGLAGNDTLDGGLGNDTMAGGAGNDIYIVNVSTDAVTELANEGTDTVQSSATLTLATNVENLVLTGTSAINATGNTLANVLTGNSAANTLDGSTGADTMAGGAGNDTYVVDNAADVVTELAGEGTDLVQSSVTYTLAANVENLTLTGTTAINGTGNTLDNLLTGNSANNTLTGAAGNDTLDGGTGNDSMLGGMGNDIYVVNIATDVVTELANEGIDTVQSSVTLTLGNNVENLTLTGTSTLSATGNTLDNVLTGNSANNTLTGAAGNDTLDGGLGNDTMVGGAGNDIYVVNVSTDVVTEAANEGTDTVLSAVTLTLGTNLENLTLTGTTALNGTGNTLNNVLLGNTGANVLAGAAGDDTYDGAAGNDTFTDTSTTSNDTYRWGIGSGLDALTDSGGTLDHVDLFAGITKSQLKFVKSGNNLELSVTGQTDKLTINSWYTSSANQIEEFRLSDGSKVLASEVQGLLSAMAAFTAQATDGFEGGRATIQPVRQYTDLLTPSATM
jgi:trimeric autotransporter adhesin